MWQYENFKVIDSDGRDPRSLKKMFYDKFSMMKNLMWVVFKPTAFESLWNVVYLLKNLTFYANPSWLFLTFISGDFCTREAV